MLHIHPLPAFNDNYIWTISHADYTGIYVVDPGDSQVVLNYLEQTHTPLLGILITHHHYDHTDGVASLQARYDIPVYGPKGSPFTGITQVLNDQDTLNLFGITFTIKAVPGHTLDHIAYVADQVQTPILFCGDTLFLAGCGRLLEGTPEQMLAAMTWLKTLPPLTHVYCTHEYSLANLAFAATVEPNNTAIAAAIEHCTAQRSDNQPTLPSSIKQELQINPFMRTNHSDVQRAACQYSNAQSLDELGVFTAIRAWKNHF